MNYKYTFLTLLLSVVAATSLSARTAKILYFKAPQEAPQEALIYQSEADPITVPLPRNNFSSTIKLKSGDTKVYFLPKQLPDGVEGIPSNAPFVNIPAEWDKVLIFATTDLSNALMPVKFTAVNANADKLGLGDIMFINSSDNKIFGMVGNKKLALQPSGSKVIKNPAAPSAEYDVELKKIKKETGKAVIFFRQVWRQSSHQSAVIFIYKPAGSTRITYYSAPVRGL